MGIELFSGIFLQDIVLVVLDDGGHLCLLQHNLRHQHSVASYIQVLVGENFLYTFVYYVNSSKQHKKVAKPRPLEENSYTAGAKVMFT